MTLLDASLTPLASLEEFPYLSLFCIPVQDHVNDSVQDQVQDCVWDPAQDPVKFCVWDSVQDPNKVSADKTDENYVGHSIPQNLYYVLLYYVLLINTYFG